MSLLKYFRGTFIVILMGFTSFFIPTIIAQETIAKSSNHSPTILQVVEQTLWVDGKKSDVFNIIQPNGTQGYVGRKGQEFNVLVENKTHVPTVIHWHGLIDPNSQDGVPYLTQLPIPPGGTYHYDFKLIQSGTYWMHAHYKLQEQKLMAAPFIIDDPADAKKDEQNVVMFIQDFTWKDPKLVYANLRKGLQADQEKSEPMQMAKTSMSSMANNNSAMKMPMKMPMQMQWADLNDVKFDSYLTNRHTLRDPDVIKTQPGKMVRLRIINGSASSNYFIDLGKLEGKAIAVDGEPIVPFSSHRFQLGLANRIDILVTTPPGKGAYPVLAFAEGTNMETGLILATPEATIPKLSEKTDKVAGVLNYSQELQLRALNPLPQKRIDQILIYNLEGNMKNYVWSINQQMWPKVTPFDVKKGERVEMVFNNKTGMSHPMHLHGTFFEVTEIDGKKFRGADRDTILVMPNSTVKVQFDANNPGNWLMHCHVLYHQAGGMMTMIGYLGYPSKFSLEQRERGDSLYNLSPFAGK
jgi:FtsP/CotA-like multicopper oxidase with cupredoxin domain